MPVIVKIPKAIREKFGDEGTDAFVDLLNEIFDRHTENIISKVNEKVEGSKLELDGRIEGTKWDLEGKIERA